jgi:hypothetical protein
MLDMLSGSYCMYIYARHKLDPTHSRNSTLCFMSGDNTFTESNDAMPPLLGLGCVFLASASEPLEFLSEAAAFRWR